MAQNDYKNLLIRLEDVVDFISQYQLLLELAYEEFENPNEETAKRVEILLSTYLCQVEPHFEIIRAISANRMEIERNKLKRE